MEYCSVKQGVRRDLTYHIASKNSLPSNCPIMSIRSNDIGEGLTLASSCIEEEVTEGSASKTLNPSSGSDGH